MKKILLIMALACITASYSFGQDNTTADDMNYDIWRSKMTFGVKLGTNYSNIYDIEAGDFSKDPKFGFVSGIFVALPISTLLGVQPEILFSQKGYKATGTLLGSSYEITRVSNYLDIPLLFALKPVESVTILAGPQYSYLISQINTFENGQSTIEQELEFDNESLRKNTFCFNIGADINLKHIVIGGRAGWDLYKNNSDGSTTTPQYKNTWYQLTLGYRF